MNDTGAPQPYLAGLAARPPCSAGPLSSRSVGCQSHPQNSRASQGRVGLYPPPPNCPLPRNAARLEEQAEPGNRRVCGGGKCRLLAMLHAHLGILCSEHSGTSLMTLQAQRCSRLLPTWRIFPNLPGSSYRPPPLPAAEQQVSQERKHHGILPTSVVPSGPPSSLWHPVKNGSEFFFSQMFCQGKAVASLSPPKECGCRIQDWILRPAS